MDTFYFDLNYERIGFLYSALIAVQNCFNFSIQPIMAFTIAIKPMIYECENI